jgi:hypothetical protein
LGLSFLKKIVRAKRGGLILVDASTVPLYEKTQRFCMKNGFKEVTRVPDYYHPGKIG